MTVTLSTTPPSRQMVGGLHILRSSDGPYLEVAERIRVVHTCGKAFSVEHGDVLCVGPGCWIYRVLIQVDGVPLIGDAELHREADLTSPEGTNPISCAQTSAIGQALEFAGFGDLKAVLARLGRLADFIAFAQEEGNEWQDEVAGVRTILLDGTPSVPVSERLFHLHQAGIPLRMEQCEILDMAGIWVYRATVMVGEYRYLGDAEIFFDAAPGTADRMHPVTCAQLAAVGHALALAGFGDVRSILQRQGKEVPGLDAPPRLASADAMLRARQQAQRAAALRLTEAGRQATADQWQQIVQRCQRLGVPLPDNPLAGEEAEHFIVRLQTEEAELLQEADEALRTSSVAEETSPVAASVVQPVLVRQLKQRWREVFQPAGESAAQLAAWDAFKRRVCQVQVGDRTMTQGQYDRLLASLPQPTSSPPVHQTPQRLPRAAGIQAGSHPRT